MKLTGRVINTWRCQVDTMIGPKPRNAFVPSTMGMEARLIDEGIYVKVLPHGTFTGSEHIVPFANIQSIRLEPDLDDPDKRKPGRPVGT